MHESPLTVLQLTFQGDGAGSTQSIFNLSTALRGRGHRVLVGCRPESLLARHAERAELDVVPLDFTRLGPLARRLSDVVRDMGVDVVNSHATRDRRALAWLRWRGRLPAAFVVTRRTMPLTSPLELWAIGRTADATIAVSEGVARALRRRWHPSARLTVVPNGIELERIDAPPSPADLAAARAALGDLGGRRVIAVVSRRKDQHVLLRALPLIDRPVIVACVGVEPDPELAAAVAALPDRHRAVFVPFVSNPLAFYHLAAAAALPSRIEGLSQALLEAMALGVPVAASRAGGNPDLISDGETGLLVDPLDPRAWAQAFARLVDDEAFARRLGDAGRRLVRSEFTVARTAERTAAVYHDAMARRASLR